MVDWPTSAGSSGFDIGLLIAFLIIGTLALFHLPLRGGEAHERLRTFPNVDLIRLMSGFAFIDTYPT